MSYDLESFPTIEELRLLRKTVVERRDAGVASWSYNGQSFTYSSPDQMNKVIAEITREIQRRMAKELGMKPASTWPYGLVRPMAREQ